MPGRRSIAVAPAELRGRSCARTRATGRAATDRCSRCVGTASPHIVPAPGRMSVRLTGSCQALAELLFVGPAYDQTAAPSLAGIALRPPTKVFRIGSVLVQGRPHQT